MSSKRGVKRRACMSKVRHKTEAEARRAIFFLRRQDRYDGMQLQTYRCRYCGGYHFGHAPRMAS